jgi:hypothetical protein
MEDRANRKAAKIKRIRKRRGRTASLLVTSPREGT